MNIKDIENHTLFNAETVIIGEHYAGELAEQLRKHDVRVISMPPNPKLDPRLCCHADLSAIYLGGGNILLSPSVPHEFLMILQKEGLTCCLSEQIQSSHYPEDCNLNAVLLNDLLIYNRKTIDDKLKPYAENGRKTVTVKQGYTRCSICIVNERAFITSDEGIAAALSAEGFDVLKINPGGINLPGFEYGFIGGASFRLASDKLAFTGHFQNHPNKKEIDSFLLKYGVKPVFLTNKPIYDIGSAIIIKERANSRQNVQKARCFQAPRGISSQLD